MSGIYKFGMQLAIEIHQYNFAMTNIKAVIVDEERLARVNLRRLLGQFPEIEIAGEADSCESAVKIINLNNPQLVFLDIQLRGETGFELLEFLENPVSIIFVTAHEKNAICAFDRNNIDYLAKPVNPERLKDAIEMVKKLLN
jgi:two-component system, LytTR family, response regulator